MQKLEIQAYSTEEAKMKAFEKGITVVFDATKAWKKAHSPILTKDLEMFAAELMESRDMLDFKGAGMIIIVTYGNSGNRNRAPYELISARRKGRCRVVRTIEVRTKKENKVVAVSPTKTEALVKAKKLIRELKEDLYAKTVYQADDIDFEMKYHPSSTSIPGQYIVFGTDDADVRISQRKRRDFN